jgi:NifU-like protein involved in Fe-S cluster formation
MTASVKGKTIAEEEALRQLPSPGHRRGARRSRGAQEASVFAGVREFPVRANRQLAWHTLQAALDAKDGVVSTGRADAKERAMTSREPITAPRL